MNFVDNFYNRAYVEFGDSYWTIETKDDLIEQWKEEPKASIPEADSRHISLIFLWHRCQQL